jgi:hypothetical protein
VRTNLGSRVCTHRAGLQTLPCRYAHSRLASLQIPGLLGCRPARPEDVARHAGLPLAPKAGHTPG